VGGAGDINLSPQASTIERWLIAFMKIYIIVDASYEVDEVTVPKVIKVFLTKEKADEFIKSDKDKMDKLTSWQKKSQAEFEEWKTRFPSYPSGNWRNHWGNHRNEWLKTNPMPSCDFRPLSIEEWEVE
jgi:hypothetical protein